METLADVIALVAILFLIVSALWGLVKVLLIDQS